MINVQICLQVKDVNVSAEGMGGTTKSQKAGRLKRLEAKIVKRPASYRDYEET